MKAALKETQAVLRKADAAWAKHSCPGTAECCQLAKTGRPPVLWPSEWELLKAKGPVPPPRADGGCPFLDAEGKRCTVYADRPLGCRTFFCQRIMGPKKLPADETNALFDRLRALNLAVDDEATPKSILEWAKKGTGYFSGVTNMSGNPDSSVGSSDIPVRAKKQPVPFFRA